MSQHPALVLQLGDRRLHAVAVAERLTIVPATQHASRDI